MDAPTLLRLQESHRSSFINDNDPEDNRLRVHLHSFKEPHDAYIPLLRASGFYHVSQISRFVVDPALITALVERWRAETHTFHLPCGECTITLEDVALHMGLSINGLPVTGPTFFNWNDECQRLLGVVPPEDQFKGSVLKLKWLQTTFSQLPVNASPQQIQQYCRAYILCLIGGILMPDKSSNRVHLMYLPLLEDFERAGRYSWGSACLATLYRGLCRATDYRTEAMSGCLWLLQSWAWYRLPFIAPRVNRQPVYPLAKRWSGGKLVYVDTPHGNLLGYRARLDRMKFDEFQWMPYTDINIQSCLPPEAFRDQHIWNACTVLICFSIIEWHHSDRVRRQFGLQQGIPQPPVNLDDMHKVDMRGNHYINWSEKHAEWLPFWRSRRVRVLEGPSVDGQLLPSVEYITWFIKNSRPYLCRQQELEHPNIIPVPAVSNSVNIIQEFDFPKPSRQRAPRRMVARSRQQDEEHNIEQQEELPNTQPTPPEPPRTSFSHPPSQHEGIEQSRHSFNATGEDFFNNLFGVNIGTPLSARSYMSQLYSFGSPSSLGSFHAGGSSSSLPPFTAISDVGPSTTVEPYRPTMLNFEEVTEQQQQLISNINEEQIQGRGRGRQRARDQKRDQDVQPEQRVLPPRRRQAPKCGTGSHLQK